MGTGPNTIIEAFFLNTRLRPALCQRAVEGWFTPPPKARTDVALPKHLPAAWAGPGQRLRSRNRPPFLAPPRWEREASLLTGPNAAGHRLLRPTKLLPPLSTSHTPLLPGPQHSALLTIAPIALGCRVTLPRKRPRLRLLPLCPGACRGSAASPSYLFDGRRETRGGRDAPATPSCPPPPPQLPSGSPACHTPGSGDGDTRGRREHREHRESTAHSLGVLLFVLKRLMSLSGSHLTPLLRPPALGAESHR